MKYILIAGGSEDPNINLLINTVTKVVADANLAIENEEERLSVFPLLFGPNQKNPSIFWNITENKIEFVNDDKVLSSLPRAMFFRFDVFSSNSSRAFAWHTALSGVLTSSSSSSSSFPSSSLDPIRCFNFSSCLAYINKPQTLVKAHRLGLLIPTSLISNNWTKCNDVAQQQQQQQQQKATPTITPPHPPKDNFIAKPIRGGGYCSDLQDAIEQTTLVKHLLTNEDISASPAIVQVKLNYPEWRIYCIDFHFITFKLDSPSLDYRAKQDVDISFVVSPPSTEVFLPLQKLMVEMGLNFAAADFKTHPETQKLVFLEINDSPMFEAFNRASTGLLATLMAEYLVLGKVQTVNEYIYKVPQRG